jgi:hypothetical protein
MELQPRRRGRESIITEGGRKMITYYSKAWLEACQNRLNTSAEHLKKAAKLSGKFMFRLWDGPDGKDRVATWVLENGKATKITFETKPAPWQNLREMPFDQSLVTRFSCPFGMLAKLNRGEMSPLKALASPEYQVEGKKTQLFKMMAGLNSWNEQNAKIECNYNFTKTDDEGNAI